MTFGNRTDVGQYVLVLRVTRWIYQSPLAQAPVGWLRSQAQHNRAVVVHRGHTDGIPQRFFFYGLRLSRQGWDYRSYEHAEEKNSQRLHCHWPFSLWEPTFMPIPFRYGGCWSVFDASARSKRGPTVSIDKSRHNPRQTDRR